jgi:hypothetical protein
MTQLRERIKSAGKSSGKKTKIQIESKDGDELPIQRKIDFNQRQVFDSESLANEEPIRKKITLLDKNLIKKSFSP